eukprot:295913-Chlamydomonas_euryale.AAC.2
MRRWVWGRGVGVRGGGRGERADTSGGRSADQHTAVRVKGGVLPLLRAQAQPLAMHTKAQERGGERAVRWVGEWPPAGGRRGLEPCADRRGAWRWWW